MLSSSLRRNPIMFWGALLGCTILLILLCIGIFLLSPDVLGQPVSTLVTSTFSFDAWTIATSHATLHFPHGGAAVEAMQNGQPRALVIFAPGELIIRSDLTDEAEPKLVSSVSRVLLYLPPTELIEAKGDTYIHSQSLPLQQEEALALLQEDSRAVAGFQLFGNSRYYALSNDTARIVCLEEDGPVLTFVESRLCRLAGRERAWFWSSQVRGFYPPLLSLLLVGILQVAVLLILLIATYFATLGRTLPPPVQWQLPPQRWLLTLALFYCVVPPLIRRLGLSQLVSWLWYLLFAGILGYLLRRGSGERLILAQRQALVANLLLGLGIGSLAVLLVTMSLPSAMPGSWPHRLLTLVLGTALAVIQELFWRGMVQESLSVRHGDRAIALTAGLYGLGLLLESLIYPTQGMAWFTALFLTPAKAILLGYTYRRSGTLVAPLGSAMALLILPELLQF